MLWLLACLLLMLLDGGEQLELGWCLVLQMLDELVALGCGWCGGTACRSRDGWRLPTRQLLRVDGAGVVDVWGGSGQTDAGEVGETDKDKQEQLQTAYNSETTDLFSLACVSRLREFLLGNPLLRRCTWVSRSRIAEVRQAYVYWGGYGASLGWRGGG